MMQRIKEGFYYINQGIDKEKYLFIKILPAMKSKPSRKAPTGQKSNLNRLSMD